MRITGARVSTAAVLVLGSMPLSAEAQCGVAYGDYAVNEEEGRIEAWSHAEEYYIPECPWYYAYQLGYFEHIYTVTAEITSPTQNVGYNEDYQVMPYGGGSAATFTSLSYLGDPGVYDIEWFTGVYCTMGGALVFWLDDDEIEPPPACPQFDYDGFHAVGLQGRDSLYTRYYMFWSDFENRIFKFTIVAFTNENEVPQSEERGFIADQALIWDSSNTTLCGQQYHSDITFDWTTNVNQANIRMSIVPGLIVNGDEAGGSQQNDACGARDCIRLRPNDERYEYSVAHEFGHSLGFLHSVIPLDVMCDGGGHCMPGAVDVFAWHIRKLLDYYEMFQ